jgi:chromosome partitioning protein
MQVISLLSRKGGSGKTTLAVHWAVEAEQSGKRRVVLIDMDEQRSCSSWFAKRDAETPLLIQSASGDIKEHLEVCRADGVDWVIIDTEPNIDTSAVHAARVSDLVVIPARPSVLDLEAIGGTVELVQGIRKQAVVILNQAPSRSGMTDEARAALAGYGLSICPVAVSNRIAFSRALIDGQVAKEIEPNGKATLEVRQSWHWILKLLNVGG